MATVRTNPLVNGMSGMLGSIVFKNYKGNTIVTSKPKPAQTQSDVQKANRSKFKAASAWAKNVLLDAATKDYYNKKAKKLKLPMPTPQPSPTTCVKQNSFRLLIMLRAKPVT